MAITGALTQFAESVVEMPGHFADVAAHDPVGAVLLTVGALLTGLSVAVFGYLSLGAILSVFTAERSSGPPRQAR